MYCFRVGHRLSTLKHTGRFIRELDVCVRWQVVWQGRRKERERGGILCTYLHMGVFFFFFFAGKHIYLGRVDCLEVNHLELQRCFLMKMLSHLLLRFGCTNYFIGSNNSRRHPHRLIVPHSPTRANTSPWQTPVDKYINIRHIVITTVPWQLATTQGEEYLHQHLALSEY